MMLTAVMSTGSAEIIAVASIIIYDIYIPYVKPFRKNAKPGHCLLCDKPLRLSIIVYNQRPLPYIPYHYSLIIFSLARFIQCVQ